MLTKTSELTGRALDLAVARIHPACTGLEFGLVDGFLCGYDPNEASQSDGGVALFIVPQLTGPGGHIRAKRRFLFASRWNPSDDWAQGGPLLEMERIETRFFYDTRPHHGVKPTGHWRARKHQENNQPWKGQGPTVLIAAMRCYVACKVGDEVDIPADLLPSVPSPA